MKVFNFFFLKSQTAKPVDTFSFLILDFSFTVCCTACVMWLVEAVPTHIFPFRINTMITLAGNRILFHHKKEDNLRCITKVTRVIRMLGGTLH